MKVILRMVIKMKFKIKTMKSNSIIEFRKIITINDNSHNNTNKHSGKNYIIYPNYEEITLSNMLIL